MHCVEAFEIVIPKKIFLTAASYKLARKCKTDSLGVTSSNAEKRDLCICFHPDFSWNKLVSTNTKRKQINDLT